MRIGIITYKLSFFLKNFVLKSIHISLKMRSIDTKSSYRSVQARGSIGSCAVTMAQSSEAEHDDVNLHELTRDDPIDFTPTASGAVLTDSDMLRIILRSIQRGEKVWRLSGVCSLWRSAIWSDPSVFRSIVVAAEEGMHHSFSTRQFSCICDIRDFIADN